MNISLFEFNTLKIIQGSDKIIKITEAQVKNVDGKLQIPIETNFIITY